MQNSQANIERYEKAVQLNDVESQSDPETEPFKSKYKARELWLELKTSLEGDTAGQCPASGSENHPTCNVLYSLAVLHFKIGVNYVETEELSSGEENLAKCLELLEPCRLENNACNILQTAYNQLGILWTTRRQPQKALKYLQKAEKLYLDYKDEIGTSPFMLDEIFVGSNGNDEGSNVQKRAEHFEHCYTLTLYYLAQVYAKLEQNDISAKYCHITLRRQLETKKYDHIDWSLNAATLSQYYITNGNHKLARHCLASAQRILLELGEPELNVNITDEDSQTDVERKEKLPRTWADLYRCWIKYGLSMLEDSWTTLLEKAKLTGEPSTDDHNADKKEDKTDVTVDKSQIESNGASSEQVKNTEERNDGDEKNKLFFELELTSLENQITDKYALDFDQAKEIFLQVQNWINRAKEFYLLDGHCTDHVELIQDHSKLFKLLAVFELDFDRQCKMHKRRIDMLTKIEEQLSQQFYLLVVRQLMYEIAETYSAMLDLKLAIIEDQGIAPTTHAVKKINTLAQQSISTFEKYVNTLKSGADKKLPEKFASDDERPALIAFFCMGRLHSKFIEFEPAKKLTNMKKSLECYKFLVDYCDKHESGKSCVKNEYEICAELVTLMPFKMSKISAQMS